MMLYQKLQEDLKQAQLSKDETRVSTLRLLLSELRYAEIGKREGGPAELSDGEVMTVIQREIKKRKEAAAGFTQGGRSEQALKEEQEAEILSQYLPAQLSDASLAEIVEDVIGELGATTLQDMGRVIGTVKERVGNQADGARISQVVKTQLGK